MSRVAFFSWVIALILISAPVRSYETSGSRWPSASTVFAVSIPGWDQAFESALGSWKTASGFEYEIRRGQYGDPCVSSATVNGVAFSGTICGTNFGSSTLAVARSVSIFGTKRFVGISFNSAKPWSIYSGPLRFSVDFRRVAVHELGHALGLSHEDGSPAIMSAVIGDIESPTADDAAGVWAIYPELVRPPVVSLATNGTYSDRVFVDWSNVPGATSYRVYRCTTTSTSSCGSAIVAQLASSFNDTSVRANTVYYYRVRACNDVLFFAAVSPSCSGFSASNSGYRAGISIPNPVVVSLATDGTLQQSRVRRLEQRTRRYELPRLSVHDDIHVELRLFDRFAGRECLQRHLCPGDHGLLLPGAGLQFGRL